MARCSLFMYSKIENGGHMSLQAQGDKTTVRGWQLGDYHGHGFEEVAQLVGQLCGDFAGGEMKWNHWPMWLIFLVDFSWLLTLLIYKLEMKEIKFSCMIWSLWSMPTTLEWMLNPKEHSTTHSQSIYLVRMFNGTVSIFSRLYFGNRSYFIVSRSVLGLDFLQRLNGNSCGVTSEKIS